MDTELIEKKDSHVQTEKPHEDLRSESNSKIRKLDQERSHGRLHALMRKSIRKPTKGSSLR